MLQAGVPGVGGVVGGVVRLEAGGVVGGVVRGVVQEIIAG